MTPYEIALHEVGISEVSGDETNPRIAEYLKTVGQAPYDEIPWCSAFVNWCVKQAGLQGTDRANARSWLGWGVPVPLEVAQIGDVVVFWRGEPDGWMGHVGFFSKHVGNMIYVLGGNQSNQVCNKGYPVDRLLGIRRMEA